MDTVKFNNYFLLLLFVDSAFACMSLSGKEENKRIVGGSEANFEEVPFIVQIERKINGKWSQYCAATMISSKVGLTSAKCFKRDRQGKTIGEFRVRSGTGDTESGGKIHMIIDKAYSKSIEENDNRDNLAVIELRPFFEGKTIALSTKEPQVGTEATIYGWGSTGRNVSPTKKLMKAELKIGSREECEEEYVNSNHPPTNKNVICTQREEDSEGKGVCTYDEGGPLIVDKKLAGVILYAGVCGQQSVPALYVNIAEYQSWIGEYLIPCKRWDE